MNVRSELELRVLMNKVSSIQQYLSPLAAMLLTAFLLITFSRWLHPALFSDTAALAVLVFGLSVDVVYALLKPPTS